jgi:hypothetical protein
MKLYFAIVVLVIISSCKREEKATLVRDLEKGFTAGYDVKIVQGFSNNQGYHYELNFHADLDVVYKDNELTAINCKYSGIKVVATASGESATYEAALPAEDTSGAETQVVNGLLWIQSQTYTISLDSGKWQSFTLDPFLLPDSMQISQLEATMDYLFVGTMALFPDLPGRTISSEDKWKTEFFPLGDRNKRGGLTSYYSLGKVDKENIEIILEGKDHERGANVNVGFNIELTGNFLIAKKSGMPISGKYIAKEEMKMMDMVNGITATITFERVK